MSPEERLNALFEEFVPISGKADTVAGEIVRAASRIGYRCYNDGDHIGVGYGNHTCNPAARYLADVTNGTVSGIIDSMWGLQDDDLYDSLLEDLLAAILEYLDENPSLKTTPNSTDMFDFRRAEDENFGEDEDW